MKDNFYSIIEVKSNEVHKSIINKPSQVPFVTRNQTGFKRLIRRHYSTFMLPM